MADKDRWHSRMSKKEKLPEGAFEGKIIEGRAAKWKPEEKSEVCWCHWKSKVSAASERKGNEASLGDKTKFWAKHFPACFLFFFTVSLPTCSEAGNTSKRILLLHWASMEWQAPWMNEGMLTLDPFMWTSWGIFRFEPLSNFCEDFALALRRSCLPNN